jgi:tetratricopeptide (TPR) repeat protein
MILEAYSKAQKHPDLEALALRLIQLFPRVGESYYYYGAALQEAKKLPEAMNALAKCYVLKNSGSDLARTRLEFIYKSQNRGSLAGMDALIQKARAEVLKPPD